MKALTSAPFELAGAGARGSTHWVLPILVPDPARVVRGLRRERFDATQWSSMTAIEPPRGHHCGAPEGARSVFDRTVFVPCYPDMSDDAVRRLVAGLGHDRSGFLTLISERPPRLPFE